MKNYLSILFALLVFLTGCEKELPFTAEVQKSKLALNSLFTSDSVWAVHVSRSLSVLDSGDLDDVYDATVNITDEAGNPVASLLHQGDGLYVADSSMPLPGVKYRVTAEAPGFEVVSAIDRIPGAVQIISIDTTTIFGPQWEDELETEITFADPAGFDNFYMVEAELRITFENPQFTETHINPLAITCTDPNIETEGGFDNTYRYLLMRDPNFDGQTYSLKFKTESFKSVEGISASIRINLVSSSEAFFNYRRSYLAYIDSNGNPFAQPVQVYSNVDGGFGIFAGAVREVWEIEL